MGPDRERTRTTREWSVTEFENGACRILNCVNAVAGVDGKGYQNTPLPSPNF